MLLVALPALAAPGGDDAMGVYAQGGHGVLPGRNTSTFFVGAMVPWGEHESPASVSKYWDLFYGQWRGRQANGLKKNFNQVGATLMWRKRFDEGQSPWFAEGGLGVSYLDGDYSIPDGRVFGSRMLFNARAGAGRSFGAHGEHELSLNYLHFSNGGIKKPNPGTDLLQVRYAYRF